MNNNLLHVTMMYLFLNKMLYLLLFIFIFYYMGDHPYNFNSISLLGRINLTYLKKWVRTKEKVDIIKF